MIKDPFQRWLRAGVLTALIDGTFSSVLASVFYGSTVMRLFQGVAVTLLGTAALEGGRRSAIIGVLMHIGVAFGWSAVFLFLAMRSVWLRTLLAKKHGVVKAAAIFGPFVWLVMSLLVVPTLLRRPPTINYRWWIQLIGHFPFVGLPIVWSIAGGLPTRLAGRRRSLSDFQASE